MRSAARSAARVGRGRFGSGNAQASVVKLWSVVFGSAVAGDPLVIGASDIVLFDMPTTPAYGSVLNLGRVNVTRAFSTELKTDQLQIQNGGVYWAGDATDLFPSTLSHKITLTGSRSIESAGNLATGATATMSFNKAITTSMGGELTLMAQRPAVTIVKLAATAGIGATSLTLDVPVTWKAGDQLHLASTDFFRSWPQSNLGNPALSGQREETVTVTADVNNSVTVPVSALTYRHHGQKMYVVPPAFEDRAGTKLSYTYRATVAGDIFGVTAGGNYLGSRVLSSAAAGASQVVDNRCTVGHLTCAINIEGATGTDWTTHGYGGTTMVMGLASKQRLQGVGFNRVGKAGQLGQYPIHHHMRSYTPFGQAGSGTYLGDVDANYNFARGCVVRDSSNRGHTVHGTCGAEVSSSILVNTDTHCLFFENGSERRNVIDGNFVSRVNPIGYGKTPILLHDIRTNRSDRSFGPAGIWYTNPDQYLRNNIVMGGLIGIWNAFSSKYSTCDTLTGTRLGTGAIAFGSVQVQSGTAFSGTPETITLTATSATVFSRSGSISGALPAVTVGVADGNGPYIYTVTAGGAAFSVGDTFIFKTKNYFGCVGASRDVAVSPVELPILQHFNNECGCQGIRATMTTGSVFDELGTLAAFANTASRIGGDVTLHAADQAYFDKFEKMNIWKSFEQWYYNQAVKPDYDGWTMCGIGPGNAALGNVDSVSQAIEGVVHVGRFKRNLMSLATLDNEGHTPTGSLITAYGGGARIVDSILIPAPMGNLYGNPTLAIATPIGGISQLADYYNFAIQLVERGSTNNSLIGVEAGCPGFFNPPHWMLASQFGISTAIFDYSLQTDNLSKGNAGYRRLPSDGSYFGMAGSWVFNHPFLTYGTTGGVPATGYYNWSTLNGVILPATYEYYSLRVVGCTGVAIDDNAVYGINDAVPGYPVNYTRLQTDAVTPVTGGTWNTPKGGGHYHNMRSAAILQGGVVDTSWSRTDMPNLPKGLILEVVTMWSVDSNFLWSVDWNGPTAVSTINFGTRVFTARTSKADILANRTSNGYWVDAPNNKLWVNVYGNDGWSYPTDPDTGSVTTWSRSPYKLNINR